MFKVAQPGKDGARNVSWQADSGDWAGIQEALDTLTPCHGCQSHAGSCHFQTWLQGLASRGGTLGDPVMEEIVFATTGSGGSRC